MKQYQFPILIFIIILATRLAISLSGSQFLFYDTGSFAFATENYDLVNSAPHMPGYYLHIFLIKFVDFFIGNVKYSMDVLSAFFSAVAAVMLFYAIKKYIPNEKLTLSMTALFFFNSVVWFFGFTGEQYTYSLFVGLAVYFLGEKDKAIFLLPFLALSAGVRPSDSMMMLPLALYYIYKSKNEILKIGISLVVAIFIFLLWFIPMINTVGTLSEYLALFSTNSPIPEYIRNRSLTGFISNFFHFVFFTYQFWVVVILIFVANLKRLHKMKENLPVFALWILPSLIFYVAYHYNKGYILLIAPALYILAIRTLDWQRRNKSLFLAVSFIQIYFIFLMPMGERVYTENELPGQLDKGIVETFNEKATYYFNISMNRFFYVNDKYEVLMKLKPRKHLKTNQKSSLLIVDIYPQNIRSLNYYNRDIKFTNIIRGKDLYAVHIGNLYLEESNISKMLSESLIVCKYSFYQLFLQEYAELLDSNEDFAILLPKKSEINFIKEILNKQTLAN